LTEEESCIE